MSTPSALARQPLAGIRVIELGRIIAAPAVAQILSDLGADVVKIEQSSGDPSRGYGVINAAEGGTGAVFATLNRGKRSVVLDLTTEEDRVFLRSLVGQADVLVHNYLDHVAAKLGFAYDDLRPVNPALIYCGVTGFGPVGPMSGEVANDLIIQAYSGLMSHTGEPDGGPVRCPAAVGDYSAGLYASIAILSALFRRAQTGQGAEVSTSLLESLMSVIGHQFATTAATGIEPLRMGSSNTLGQPNQAFRTRDGWVVISAINDEMWLRCARALGGQELADDPRFSELAGRYANRGQMLDEVQRRVELLSTSECVALLSAATVTAAPILTVGDTIASEQVAALGTLTQGQIGSATIPVVGSPIWVDGARVAGPTAIPELGADRDDVLADWVGRNARTRSGTEAVTAKESA